VTLDTIRASLRDVDRYATAHDYTGPDPYDALNSPVGQLLHGRRPRQALVQLVRRAPTDLRAALRVRPVRMAKALALFCSGLVRAPWLPDATKRADLLATELALGGQPAWGYEFDVQTRWGFYPAHSPNIIATSFVLEALHDVGAVDKAAAAGSWLEQCMLTPHGHVRYVPGNDRLIHNANILGARALLRVAPDHPAIAPAVHCTLRAQRPDGLWPYGDGPDLGWIDNFHTAYVLLGLRDLTATVPEAEDALRRGVRAWLTRCFERDGTPRYYADRCGRRDVHNVATAVHALAAFSDDEQARSLLTGAVRTLSGMQRADGAFVAVPREPPYMRWNQAHAFRALSEVCVSGMGGNVGLDHVASGGHS
jgi:hypothetical protein